MTGRHRARLMMALVLSMMGCDAGFRCDPSPSWRSGPHTMTDAAMPSCTTADCLVATVAAGARHTCAVVGNELEVVCWGANEVGQSDWHAPSTLVTPTRVNQRVFLQSTTAYRPLAASDLRTCVSALDRIMCWGGPSPSPQILPFEFERYLEVGLDDVCAMTHSGNTCLSGPIPDASLEPTILGGATRARWSEGAWRIRGLVPGAGLLRERPSFEMEIPTQFGLFLPGNNTDIRNTLAVGALHSCALDFSQGTRCVGRGDRGQLGTRYIATDAPEGTRIPTRIGTPDTLCVGGHVGARWTPDGVVTTGPIGGHTCRLFARETGPTVEGVYCMGANDRGQLGLGLSVDTDVFTRVVGLPHERVQQIYCGGEHTCARTDTELFCWGDNRFGQLAVAPSELAFSARPVRIDLASAFAR